MSIPFAPAAFLCFAVLFHNACRSAEFAAYPGAALDKAMSEKSTKVAIDTGSNDQVSVFTTRDPFDRVAGFYSKLGVEYQAPWAKASRRLPDGREIKVKVFLLDGKGDVAESKRWVQVQYPFIGEVEMTGTTPNYRDVRDATVIIYTFMK